MAKLDPEGGPLLRRLRIGVIDLVTKGPSRSPWARVMRANLASIIPQVVAVWCEAEGHEVTFVCYTGLEDVNKGLPQSADLVFICSFTEAARFRFALGAPCRGR